MAGVTSDLTQAMLENIQQVNTHLEDQKAFAQAVKVFHNKLLRDLDDASSDAKTYFGRLLGDVDTAMQAVIRKIFTTGEAAEASIRGMEQVGIRLLLPLKLLGLKILSTRTF